MARQQRPVPLSIPPTRGPIRPVDPSGDPRSGPRNDWNDLGISGDDRPGADPGDRPSRRPATFPLRRRIAATLGVAALAGGLLGGCSLLPSASATPAGNGDVGAVVVTTIAPDAAGDEGIVCPDVTGLLTDVPADAQAQVERELAGLENQIAEANERLVATEGQGGPNFVQNAILGPLEGKRTAALDRIRIAIERVGGDAPDLADLATCQLAE